MSDSGTARQSRCAVRAALFGALALMLAGCAGADVPVPFVSTPEPETTATAPQEPASEPAAQAPVTNAPAAPPAAPPAANGQAGSGPAPANGAARAHSPVRQEMPFPSFSTPAVAGERPVLTDAEKAKMQSDLEALAKSRENKMRNEIEQSQ